MKRKALTTVFALIIILGSCNYRDPNTLSDVGAIPTRINAFWGDSSTVL